jgi:diacylglycerol kinase (ATP)
MLSNPTSAGGRKLGELARSASAHAVEHRVCRSAEELADEARAAIDAGRERLLVAGGDGTLHVALGALAGSDCALGVVPTGTGNDLARSLGLLEAPERALGRALTARPRRIDLGRVDDRPYAGVAGLGLDGEVNRYLARRFPGRRRPWMYAWATLRTLASFRPPGVRARFDGEDTARPTLLAALANSGCFGGGMRIAPGARLDDGLLDLVWIAPVSFPRLLLLFPRVYRGAHIGHPAVLHRPVASARLSVEGDPVTLYADGEPVVPVGRSEVEVRCWPGALWVV